MDFTDALAKLERWSRLDPWTCTFYQLLKMSEDYRRFSRRNMNIFDFIFVVIFAYEWNILSLCTDTSFSVREILPRYAWKRTRTLTTLEGSPVDAAMIRLRPDADQRIVTLDRGWSPVTPFPAQRILLRMDRKTDHSPSAQRLKVHYTLLKIVAIQWNNTH